MKIVLGPDTVELDQKLTDSEARRPRLLLAEDDSDMRAMLKDWLDSIGCDVIECESGGDLFGFLVAARPDELRDVDLIVSDLRMPGFDGLEAIEYLWFLPLPRMILITAYRDLACTTRAQALGVEVVLSKPIERDAFLAAVVEALVEPPRTGRD